MAQRARGLTTVAAALLVPLVGGCGGRAADAEPDVPRTSAPVADDPAARVAAVTKAFETFSYARCAGGEDCPLVFARAANQEAAGPGAWNPRGHMGASPDATWVVEWARLPSGAGSARYVYAALALAAVRRSWAEQCGRAYVGYRKDLDARLGELEPKLARLRIEPNPYDRIGGVLALEPDKPKKGDDMGEFVKGSDAVRYAYEAALYDAFNDSSRTFVYAFDGYAPSDALVDVIKPRQAPDYERDAFCLDAAAGRVPGADPLPDTSSWDAEVREMVRPAVPIERKSAVEARRSQLVLQVRAKFKNAMTRTPSLPTGIREISVGTVAAFERSGRAAKVTVTQTKEDRKTVDGVSRLQKVDEVSVVDFKDWPSGIILEPGDSVSFYGAELTVKETTIKSTPELEHLSRQRTVDGRHVTKTVTKKDGTKLFFR